MKTKLQKIAEKYSQLSFNEENYEVGGGLVCNKFASNRHEDARNDEGKLTLGEATQLFKKATGLEIDLIKDILNFAVPNMEWHHAGKLPKAYGGGMKKTYFLNAKEIADLAVNWDSYCEKFQLSIEAKKTSEETKKTLEEKKLQFLQENAKKVERVTDKPKFFIKEKQEMLGKYGWFDSSGKSYNLTEYYSGWEFDSYEMYCEFLNIK